MNHNYEPFLDESNSYFIAFEDFKEDASIRNTHIDFNDENFIAIGDTEYNEWEEYELNKLSLLFESLYIEMNKGMIYFYGCQFEVYSNTYPLRLQSFLYAYSDATEADFCEYEFKKNSINYVSSVLLKDKMTYSIKKRNEFLNEKMGFNKSPITEPEAIDLSNTKAIDKILYLHKLGIIDFLRERQPFNTSVNSLATIFSAITGEKSGTLQPMLNPMLSKKVDESNNPLHSSRAIERVKSQLISIGFNLNDTI